MSLFVKIRRASMEQKSHEATNNVNLFRTLISEQQWTRVENILMKSSEPNQSPSANLFMNSTFTVSYDTILHDACQSNAPIKIIAKLSAQFSSSMKTTDDGGRYPIHLAVASGCHPSVIRFLIQTNPQAVGLQDHSGKTPLHYAAEHYAQNFNDNNFRYPNYSEAQRNTLQVVEALVESAPESVNIEDGDEMNPIEYALLNVSHIKIVKTLQRASRKDWRRRKTLEQESSPSTLDLSVKSAPQGEIKPMFSKQRRLGASTA